MTDPTGHATAAFNDAQTERRLHPVFAALVAFQRSMENVTKDKTANTGKFGYRYADIAGVIEAVKEPLAAQGLCYLQVLDQIDGKPALRTILAHESGASIEGILPFQGDLTNPQTFGGVVTYYRRYALLGILGLATDDDDAQSVSQPQGYVQRNADTPRGGQSLPHKPLPQTTPSAPSGTSQRVDEEMDWTEMWKLIRPFGPQNKQQLEVALNQSIDGMTPVQVYDAFKGNAVIPPLPKREVQWPLSEKQLHTIRTTLPKKGMDEKAWPGFQMFTLATDEEIAPADLSKVEASKIIDALFALADDKNGEGRIAASGR